MKVDTYNTAAKKVGTLELSDEVFGADYNEALIHQVVVAQLANKRQGTKSTITRSEVRGGGKKPWRQKGTGRARQGSIRSPQWTKGGVVFAPKPRDFSQKINKKMKRLATISALSAKVRDNDFIVLDSLELAEAKTKLVAAMLKSFNLEDKKVLIVTANNDNNAVLAARNIQGASVTEASLVNVYDLVAGGKCIVTKEAVALIEEAYKA